MTKLFSILTSCLILVQSFNIDLNDLVKLDELIEHSKFHAEAYGDSFFSFVSKHYGELKQEHHKEHKEEKKDHEQLPFNHQSHTQSSIDIVLVTPDLELLRSETITDNRSNFFYQELFSLFEKTAVFQPPKFA